MTAAELLDLLSKGGVLAGAILLIVALYTERLVPKARLDEQRADKREAIEMAKTAQANVERLSDGVERVLDIVQDRSPGRRG